MMDKLAACMKDLIINRFWSAMAGITTARELACLLFCFSSCATAQEEAA